MIEAALDGEFGRRYAIAAPHRAGSLPTTLHLEEVVNHLGLQVLIIINRMRLFLQSRIDDGQGKLGNILLYVVLGACGWREEILE